MAVAKVAGVKPDLHAKRSAVPMPGGDTASLVDESTPKATLSNGEKPDLAGLSSDTLKSLAHGVRTYLINNPNRGAYSTV